MQGHSWVSFGQRVSFVCFRWSYLVYGKAPETDPQMHPQRNPCSLMWWFNKDTVVQLKWTYFCSSQSIPSCHIQLLRAWRLHPKEPSVVQQQAERRMPVQDNIRHPIRNGTRILVQSYLTSLKHRTICQHISCSGKETQILPHKRSGLYRVKVTVNIYVFSGSEQVDTYEWKQL